MQDKDLTGFQTVFNELIGYKLFHSFITDGGVSPESSKRCIEFHRRILEYKDLDCTVARKPIAKKIYNEFIMQDLLVMDHPFSIKLVNNVKGCLANDETDQNLFDVSYFMIINM